MKYLLDGNTIEFSDLIRAAKKLGYYEEDGLYTTIRPYWNPILKMR